MLFSLLPLTLPDSFSFSRKLTIEQISLLTLDVIEEEIKVIFNSPNNKVIGSYGFIKEFFVFFWDLVEHEVFFNG